VSDLLRLDGGTQSGRAGSAFDRRWFALHQAGERPDLLRFHSSTACVSVGCNQAVDREVRTDYCRARGIEIVRRPTGGGSLYHDGGQLGLSLVLDAAGDPLAVWMRRIGCALAAALRELGADAVFAAPNDIEVAGRKIASVFAAIAGRSALIQSWLLHSLDVRAMLEALRVPTEKLSADGLAAARERVTAIDACVPGGVGREQVRETVERALARALGAVSIAAPADTEAGIRSDALLDAEARAAQAIDWSDAQGWIEAVTRGAGSTLRVRARFSEHAARLEAIEFAADGFTVPAAALERIAQALCAGELRDLAKRARSLAAEHLAQAVGFGADDLCALLQIAAEKRALAGRIGLDDRAANALMVVAPEGQRAEQILAAATVMLVPYCAKPSWCRWRHQDGCSECGLCEVGDAYAMARSRGMRVTTITRYEHLVETLAGMQAERVPAYVGMCCGSFFIKRFRAFRDAALPAVLMDISGANCYELGQENLAYAGSFQAEAKLDAALLEKVMRFVPGAARRPE
jgi:lipoate-protein ligase A